jgi:hypothetical protein
MRIQRRSRISGINSLSRRPLGIIRGVAFDDERVRSLTRLRSNPMCQSALEEAEAESWDEPGVEIQRAI